jgi:hypothetical protein
VRAPALFDSSPAAMSVLHAAMSCPACYVTRPSRACCLSDSDWALPSKCRPVVESILTALPDGRTAYRIRTTIIFVIKPNGFIKTMIDRGEGPGNERAVTWVDRLTRERSHKGASKDIACTACCQAGRWRGSHPAALAAVLLGPFGFL